MTVRVFVGVTLRVGVGDGLLRPAGRPPGPWKLSAWRPWCSCRLVVRGRAQVRLARRWCPRGGHEPGMPLTPRPGGVRSCRTPPGGSGVWAGHVRRVDTRGARARSRAGHEPALRAVGSPGAGARSPRALPLSPLRCGRARPPLVTTLRTRASAPRRHPGSWPDVMVFRAGAWTAHAKPVHLVPQPSISFLGPPSRSFTQRDQRVRNEIDVREARARPGQRDRRARNEPQPSISSLYLPSRPSALHLVRSRNEINVCETRSTYEGREQDLGNEIDAGPRRVLRAPRPDTPILARARDPSAGARRASTLQLLGLLSKAR